MPEGSRTAEDNHLALLLGEVTAVGFRRSCALVQ